MPERPSGLRNLFRHRMGYGGIIPPDARVTPEAFPEDKFPLYCPSCDYLLRGLPSERCPECGYTYDRGRLLIEQYVIEQGTRTRRRVAKWARWTGLLGCGLAILDSFSFWIVYRTRLFTIMSVEAFVKCVLATGILGAILFFASTILSVIAHWRTGAKVKQVFAAINKDTPTFKRAQRYQWGFPVVWIVAVACVFAWDSRGRNGWARFYLANPRQALLCVGLAAAAGGALLLGSRGLSRLRRSLVQEPPDAQDRCDPS